MTTAREFSNVDGGPSFILFLATNIYLYWCHCLNRTYIPIAKFVSAMSTNNEYSFRIATPDKTVPSCRILVQLASIYTVFHGPVLSLVYPTYALLLKGKKFS